MLTRPEKRFLVLATIVLVVLAVTTIIVVVIVYNTDDANDDIIVQPSTDTPQGSPVVTTSSGSIIGRLGTTTTLTGESKQVYDFINIPYAHPPMRWKRPRPCTKESPCWSGLYQANISSNIQCAQMIFIAGRMTPLGSEDCLYLTVHSPSLSGKRPVLVWIHGGSLLENWSTRVGYSIDGELALDLDVVGVNINYRLSALGFLSMEELWHEDDPKSYGNYGFFDQLLALQWIKQNIASFGGDPNSITLMGESSGATSVFAQVSAPMANGLFHRAIIMSSLPNWENDYKSAAMRNTQSFMPILAGLENCDISTFANRQKCLNNAELHNLTTAVIIQVAAGFDAAAALPRPNEDGVLGFAVIEPILIPKDPRKLACVNFATTSRIPVLIGNLAQETNTFITDPYAADDWSRMHDHVVSQLALFNITDTDHVFELYPNMTSTNQTIPPQRIFDQMVSDIRVTCPTNTAAEKMAESTQHAIYRYYISHRPSSAVSIWTGSYHAWDTEALFNFQLSAQSFNFTPTQHDFEFRDKLREIFKEFAHSGSLPSGWKPFPENTYIIPNNATKPEILDGYVQKEQCSYWDSLGFQRFAWHN